MKIKIVHHENIDDQCIKDITTLLAKHQNEPNLEINDWQNKPHTLLNIICLQPRFSKNNGGLVLVYEQDNLIALSGYNSSIFHPHIYVLGVRTLIDTAWRHKLLMSSLIIPEQLKQISAVAKMAVFLFDEKKEFNLYDIYKRGKLNLFLKNKYNLFDEMWDKLQAVEFPISIYSGVNQSVLYIKLDESFEFDWHTIRAKNV